MMGVGGGAGGSKIRVSQNGLAPFQTHLDVANIVAISRYTIFGPIPLPPPSNVLQRIYMHDSTKHPPVGFLKMLWVLLQTRILVPPTPPLYYINFAKNQKNSESTHNGLKQQEIRKCPLVTLNPKKNLEIFSKFFFKNFLKVIQNHLEHEKTPKKSKNFHFFPVETWKNFLNSGYVS